MLSITQWEESWGSQVRSVGEEGGKGEGREQVEKMEKKWKKANMSRRKRQEGPWRFSQHQHLMAKLTWRTLHPDEADCSPWIHLSLLNKHETATYVIQGDSRVTCSKRPTSHSRSGKSSEYKPRQTTGAENMCRTQITSQWPTASQLPDLKVTAIFLSHTRALQSYCLVYLNDHAANMGIIILILECSSEV